MTPILRAFWRKKTMVIKAWHKETLVLMSYENPCILSKGPIQDIVGIDRIEVSWEYL